MFRLTVLYGHPEDPEAFDHHYHTVHIPLAKKMKGLKGWTIGKCQTVTPGEKPQYYMIVGLYTETRAEMEAILQTPEGMAAVADVSRFANGGCTFLFNDEEVLVPFSLS